MKANTDVNTIQNNNNKSTLLPETTSTKLLRGYSLPPTFYAKYIIGQELGSGGFGFVLSVTERATGLERAIKFIYKNKVPPSAWITHHGQRLPIEIYILKYVQHDNIVNYVESFEDDTYFYLVMELHGSQWNQPITTLQHIPSLSHTGSESSASSSDDDDEIISEQHSNASINISRRGSCDLFECIEQHRSFEEPLAKHIFRQIVECIAFLDKQGICHRDIKDENIVIDHNYQVKLIDFGSAITLPRHFNKEDSTIVLHRKFYGTIAFASPEILRMEPYRAESAEVWSLGVLLYTLVFGEVPFSNPRMALNALFHPPTKKTASKKLLNLIACLLEKNPHRRPTIHQILTHPWLKQ
ncbi:kinase-like domain-containing protein [Cunninghamella echinulata]|nr:kinase-like domain-containing protein [Cunninghamella echinulata]